MIVLLLEDNATHLKQMEEFVAAALPCSKIHSFSAADDAMAFASAELVQVAFLAVSSNGVNGFPVAAKLQEQNPKVNLVFCADSKEYAMDALEVYCSGYLLKPVTKESIQDAVMHLRYPLDLEPVVTFTCFGNFEAYCDGIPIKFKYSRTKEMLAYLVDRNGASISVGELSCVLFEDDQHRSYLNQIRLDLINTFHALGAADVIRQTKGYLGINRSKVHCDYFDYLDHKFQVTTREYMTQYSFSEYTYSSIFLDGTYPAIELEE